MCVSSVGSNYGMFDTENPSAVAGADPSRVLAAMRSVIGGLP